MAVQIPFSTIDQARQTAVVEDAFFTYLLQQCLVDNLEESWLKDIRQHSKTWLSSLSVPTKKDEEWRFLDLADLTARKFLTSSIVKVSSFSPTLETKKCCLVFLNGRYNPELSDISELPDGIYVGSLNDLPKDYDPSKYFAQQHGSQTAFTALNTAGGSDIAVIWANKNAIVKTPVHLVFITNSDSEPVFTQPRSMIVAESNASISVLEEYIGTGEYFTNAVTEVFVQDNARLNHTRIQEESDTSFHIGKTAISQQRDSHYTISEINLGAKLSRHNPEAWQQGEHTETDFNGLTVVTEAQTSDTHSVVALTKPSGMTNQLHKCIVDDRAHTVFNGKVFVTKEAQLTDATQLNRNLLLSSKARVDTKPELQITADNVKCAHGATVSQLEADEIFYLRSRGLNESEANQLLIDAFAAEIIDRIPLASLRDRITQAIEHKIK